MKLPLHYQARSTPSELLWLSLTPWAMPVSWAIFSIHENRVCPSNTTLVFRTLLWYYDHHSCSANTTLVLLSFHRITITVSYDTKPANTRYRYNSEAVTVQGIRVTVYAVLKNRFWNLFMNLWPLNRIASEVDLHSKQSYCSPVIV